MIIYRISELYESSKQKARQNRKSSNVENLITLIFTKRTVTANDVMQSLNLSSHTSAMDLLRKLTEVGLLTNTNLELKRNIHFTNEPLIRLLESL